ncbi:hypothetical protein J3458_009115 [Metarhizium acridum]|uniref:uncharacterized protein n=1 Tax=Metarhizium acridum TaxID=92637 RepID=UPI001C6C2519|nr:hypothetical protein J3458_009115 [Metarhizium acridum]
MTGIQDLQPEILKEIFDLVIAAEGCFPANPGTSSFEQPDDGLAILNLALTCRRFSSIVEQIRFRYLFAFSLGSPGRHNHNRYVELDDIFRRNPLSCLRCLHEALQRKPELGNQCREFGVFIERDQFAEGEEFFGCLEYILSALPNVEKLRILASPSSDPQTSNTLIPRTLGLAKDMSRLVKVTITTVDHIRELGQLYSVQWPPSARKLHVRLTDPLEKGEDGDQQVSKRMVQFPTTSMFTNGIKMLRGVGQECNITSLSITGIEDLFDLPRALEGFPNALEELTLLYKRQLMPHIPFSIRFDGHKHSLRALSLVFCSFGFPETLNLSDCTALEHLSLHYRDLNPPFRLQFGGAVTQFAAHILGPKLKRLTWVFHYENKPGLLGKLFEFPHSVRELFLRHLAKAAGQRAAALEEIHVIWMPRDEIQALDPDPLNAVVVDKVNLSEKVTLTYSAAGMSHETRLEVFRALQDRAWTYTT